jgi:hypothetical protein
MRIPELYTQKPVLQINVDTQILTVFKNKLQSSYHAENSPVSVR